MDQAKTRLPYYYIGSKIEGEHVSFLKVHVTGAISHGNNTAMCFLDLMRWPHDANSTMNFMLETLRRHKLKNGRLPSTLYWQMDNCYRDCKNIYILAFCSLLVMTGVFKKVRLSYLIVGHTHADVDQ
ncbi:uncharacterized protein LOC114574953 [Exaiptasia diaphana]|uniref:DUF7869 domain-containing protein n=1 Tax=Exaiptasia diaphana TaxID=2652724 RepID=A0A913YGR9_EXADI|nr:uncharacterized protein LOC114574953 [Exaiptasia diaphana]